MKIFSAEQIRVGDQFTIEHEPISSVDLMERAARECYNWFHNCISRDKSIAVLCGKGNNGGDGLALARMLKAAGYQIQLIVIEHSTNSSNDFDINFSRLKDWHLDPIVIGPTDGLTSLEAEVWVDAILGSGLNKPLRGLIADVISVLNAKSGLKVSIDIPTGLFADDNSQNDLEVPFKADHTLTFQFPKRSFLFPEYGGMVGNIVVLDIGISETYINQTSTNRFYNTGVDVEVLLPRRNKFDHKGTYGHALIIGGSLGKIGAVNLSAHAALKAGAGLVFAYVPQCGIVPLQSSLPEVMVQGGDGDTHIQAIKLENTPSAIGIGPGLGTNEKTAKALVSFLEDYDKPVVLDADALNIISQKQAWSIIPKHSILTPHLGELTRMLGKNYVGEALEEPARNFAMKHNVNSLVKGAHTAVYAANGNVYFNSSGSNAMATAGSGDVLTGIVTGLLAQGLAPLDAAIAGAYYHGVAGEMAASQLGERAVIAGDISKHLAIL